LHNFLVISSKKLKSKKSLRVIIWRQTHRYTTSLSETKLKFKCYQSAQPSCLVSSPLTVHGNIYTMNKNGMIRDPEAHNSDCT